MFEGIVCNTPKMKSNNTKKQLRTVSQNILFPTFDFGGVIAEENTHAAAKLLAADLEKEHINAEGITVQDRERVLCNFFVQAASSSLASVKLSPNIFSFQRR